MSIKAGVIAHLLADAAVAAIVGLEVYHVGEVPQGTAGQRIVIQKISDPGHYHLGGRTDVANTRIQISVWTPGGYDAGEGSVAHETLCTAVRDSVDGFHGTMGAVPKCVVRDKNEPDAFVVPRDGSSDGDFHTPFTFTIWHPRSAAA